MIEWIDSLDAAEQRMLALQTVAQQAQDFAYAAKAVQGWCAGCRRRTTMRLAGDPDGWINLRERLLCECGTNGRLRMICAALDELQPRPRFLAFERVTPLFKRLQERFPSIEGCEYFGADHTPGTEYMARGIMVRHEDMQALSYDSQTFSFVFHGDVLEHVPDPQQALRECHRVLKPGGTLLFTCPMANLARHIVRARMVGGQLQHLLPPAYHGNPMDETGALVFTEPGLELLADIADAGFQRVQLGFAFDPGQGILRDGNPYADFNMWPLVFRATRSA